MDRLTTMAVFVRAADLGSFTAAGIALGMSSQLVGKHVAALEARLGAPLLQRTTRRQNLTDLGRMYYERCRTILAEVDAADALVHDLSMTARGRLRISAPVSFGACSLAPVILQYLDVQLGIELELTLTDRYVDVIDEGFDAVVRLGPIGDTSLGARELVGHAQVACASPAYLKANGLPQTPDDLKSHACLSFVNWSGRPFAEWRFTRDGDIHSVQIRSRFQVNDGRVLLDAALGGHGVILQPEAVVRQALEAGSLVAILPDYTPPSRPMYLLFATRQPQLPKLRTFIDHIVAAFGYADANRQTP